jgi:hypothetical protein
MVFHWLALREAASPIVVVGLGFEFTVFHGFGLMTMGLGCDGGY